MLQVTTREKSCCLHPGLWDWVARLNYGGQKSECQGPRRWCYCSGATGLDVHGWWGGVCKRKLSYIDWACVKCAKVWSKCTWRIAGCHHMLLAGFCPQDFFYNAFWVSAIALRTLKNLGRLFCFGGDKKKEETHQLLGTFRWSGTLHSVAIYWPCVKCAELTKYPSFLNAQ